MQDNLFLKEIEKYFKIQATRKKVSASCKIYLQFPVRITSFLVSGSPFTGTFSMAPDGLSGDLMRGGPCPAAQIVNRRTLQAATIAEEHRSPIRVCTGRDEGRF
jgi:hypothetical protein